MEIKKERRIHVGWKAGLVILGLILLVIFMGHRSMKKYNAMVSYESAERSMSIEIESEGEMSGEVQRTSPEASPEEERAMEVTSVPSMASAFSGLLSYLKELSAVITSLLGLILLFREVKGKPSAKKG